MTVPVNGVEVSPKASIHLPYMKYIHPWPGIEIDGGDFECFSQTLDLFPIADPTTQTSPPPMSITNKKSPFVVMQTGNPLNMKLISLTENGSGSKKASGPVEENSASNP